jgi:multimeric flavodoxin WrbA
MKVVAFNGSPKMDKGMTALILAPFLEGLQQGGAEVELFYTKKLNINPCNGEFNCWLKTPGHCYQDDDMQAVHPKLRQADVWVFATPVYVWGPSGPLKNLMDRILPLVEPFIVLRDGHCAHPIRQEAKVSKVVLVSSCGFWEMDNFDPLLAQVQALCRIQGMEFAGALLRPHSAALPAMLQMGMPVGDVVQAAGECGRQLATQGRMAPETLATVCRNLMPRQMYVDNANQFFARELRAAAGND